VLHQEAFDRLSVKYPEAVMVRATLENALPPTFVDDVFSRYAGRLKSRKLLFSTVVALLSLVVCRVRNSVHASYQLMEKELSVGVKTVYNRLNSLPSALIEALVRESALRMFAIVDALQSPLPPIIPGWKTRIVDGNHLAATEHRIQPLRTLGGGALPGLGLVVYDAERGLVQRAYLSEDGHEQERSITIRVLEDVGPGEVWIADRAYATCVFMHEIRAQGSHFIVRRHQTNGRIVEQGEWTPRGLTETGEVYERPGQSTDEFGKALDLRIIRLDLFEKTRDGDRSIEILSDLPLEISALTIAEGFRGRWRIETAFAHLESVFEGEISSLGHPSAALLAFALALIAYNTLGVVMTALRKKHGAEKVANEVSHYFLGERVSSAWSAMDLFIEDDRWVNRYADKTPQEIATELMRLVDHISMRKLKKHPRGKKKPVPKRKCPKDQPHFATSRILAAAKAKNNRSKRKVGK
jgi:IS4 transposase